MKNSLVLRFERHSVTAAATPGMMQALLTVRTEYAPDEAGVLISFVDRLREGYTVYTGVELIEEALGLLQDRLTTQEGLLRAEGERHRAVEERLRSDLSLREQQLQQVLGHVPKLPGQ